MFRTFKRAAVVAVGALAIFSVARPASAQFAREEWHGGVRYLFVYNNTPVIMHCRILDQNGSWFQANIAPGQHVFKPVHPQNAAQWNCVPL